ncbi:DnaJ family domain-containing protein [Paenibacillus mesotrionivorans]|uniref:DnaJ family domain-containing protein n=1 Tax=Paenibacillus mesotrionivorans TaxID=3160968 RepID=A0ACC7NVU3_9BACL
MWPSRPKHRHAQSASLPENEPRPTIPLPAEVYVDQDAVSAGHTQVAHWLDEKYEEFVAGGGLDRLPGKGKPLTVPTGDVMNTILKQAGVPHPWVLLRLTIKESIEDIAHLLKRAPDDPSIDGQLAEVNKRIVQYNVESPSMALHRRKLTRENIRAELEKWK